MTTGWIISGNKGYSALVDILQLGLMKPLSKHPSKRFDNEIQDAGLAAFEKLNCLANSPFDFSVWLDADTVPNWTVDDLMDVCVSINSPFPILQRHITPAGVSIEVLDFFHATQKPKRYGQGNMIMVSPKAKEWIRLVIPKIQEAMSRFKSEPGTYEETFLNAALWAESNAELVNYCTPRAESYYAYIRGCFDHAYPGNVVTWQAFHNIKWNIVAWELLQDILARPPSSFNDWSKRSLNPVIVP